MQCADVISIARQCGRVCVCVSKWIRFNCQTHVYKWFINKYRWCRTTWLVVFIIFSAMTISIWKRNRERKKEKQNGKYWKMVTPKNRRRDVKKRSNWIAAVDKFHTKYCNVNYVHSLIFDPVQLPVVSVAILLAELILNVFIVQRIRYTEIDWIAYMQECEGFLNGTTNYSLLRGTLAPMT